MKTLRRVLSMAAHAVAFERAIVTGAGSGIGRATAAALCERGLEVYGVGRREGALRETARTRVTQVAYLCIPCCIGVGQRSSPPPPRSPRSLAAAAAFAWPLAASFAPRYAPIPSFYTQARTLSFVVYNDYFDPTLGATDPTGAPGPVAPDLPPDLRPDCVPIAP